MKILERLSIGMLVAALAGTAHAQGARRGGGNYDPATETTIAGTIDEVRTVPSTGRGGGGLHLILATPGGSMEVHVGPASFVTSKKFAFEKGDAVSVLGSKVTLDGQQVVIAREITKGDQVLTLRDAKGIPLWSGRGRGR